MRKIQILLAVVIILTVATVLIVPSVDLDPSALRSVRAAALIFFAIFIAGNCLTGRCSAQYLKSISSLEQENIGQIVLSVTNLLDLHCSLLC